MSPALDQRTAPGLASGAVSFRPDPSDTADTTRAGDGARPATAPPLRERDFWRAVAGSALATLRPWLH